MRLHPQMVTGQSLLQPESGPTGHVTTAWNATLFRPLFVRGRITEGYLPEPLLDFAAIEREAREAQSAWIANALKSFFKSLLQKFGAQSKVSAAAATRNRARKKAVRVTSD